MRRRDPGPAPLPEGAGVTTYPSGMHRAHCRCDWAGSLCSHYSDAVADAERHAERDAWCYFRARRLEIAGLALERRLAEYPAGPLIGDLSAPPVTASAVAEHLGADASDVVIVGPDDDQDEG